MASNLTVCHHTESFWETLLLRSCRPDFSCWICYVGNLCGLASTGIWFLVLLPQIYRCFVFRSCEGVSLGWALANFTAALNNCFFVFRYSFEYSVLPVYSMVSAVYMPLLEAILLLEFYVFAPATRNKNILALVCIIIWAVNILLQSFFHVYLTIEWLSITLWSVETFPQIFLNSQRQTTYGLSKLSVALTSVGKSTDIIGTYVLLLPMQYVVMAYFSSTVAQICTLQVLWYWNRVPEHAIPAVENPHFADEATSSIEDISQSEADVSKDVKSSCDDKKEGLVTLLLPKSCNIFRYVGISFFVCELMLFNVAIVWRTGTFWAILAPLGTYTICVTGWLWYHWKFLVSLRQRIYVWLRLTFNRSSYEYSTRAD